MNIILDTFPTSSVSIGQSGKEISTISEDCRKWIDDCEKAGHRVLVPAISYYEVLRELEQRQAMRQIGRLKAYCLQSQRFIALTTRHLETAAALWGQSRRSGQPTADPKALDGDVILAAQVIGLGMSMSEVIVATTNPSHLSRYIPADLWTNITP